jgi:secreted trypsin-like serine protease
VKKASTLLCLGLISMGLMEGSAPGAPQASPSVAGGIDAPSWFIPGATYIRYGYPKESFCSADLIAPKRVLTAAHCVDKRRAARKWTAFVGARDAGDRTTPRDGEQIGVTGIAMHPQYRYPHHDVAVMFLKRAAATPPTPVATQSEWANSGYALGWGHNNYDHRNPTYQGLLKTVLLGLGTDADCQSYTTQYDPSVNMCTWNAGSDCTTHGDSGGPFVIAVNGVWKQVGVLSGGARDVVGYEIPCGSQNWFDLWAWVGGDTLRSYVFGVGNPACLPARKKFKRVKRIWTKRSKPFRSAKKFKRQACQGI